MNPEEKQRYEELIKEEVAKQMQGEEESSPFRNEAYSLAGGAVGGGLGLASINAVEEVKQQSSIKSAERQNLHRSALKKLKDIHDGRAGWETVNPEAKPILEDMYRQNEAILKDDTSYKQMMNQLGEQKVHVINPGTRMQSLKRALPNGALIDNLGQNLKHPAVSVGGLAGMTAGYYLSRMTDK